MKLPQLQLKKLLPCLPGCHTRQNLTPLTSINSYCVRLLSKARAALSEHLPDDSLVKAHNDLKSLAGSSAPWMTLRATSFFSGFSRLQPLYEYDSMAVILQAEQEGTGGCCMLSSVLMYLNAMSHGFECPALLCHTGSLQLAVCLISSPLTLSKLVITPCECTPPSEIQIARRPAVSMIIQQLSVGHHIIVLVGYWSKAPSEHDDLRVMLLGLLTNAH